MLSNLSRIQCSVVANQLDNQDSKTSSFTGNLYDLK